MFTQISIGAALIVTTVIVHGISLELILSLCCSPFPRPTR